MSYGEALGKVVWNYLRLSDYFRVKYSSVRWGLRSFDNVESYWKSAIEEFYIREAEDPSKRLRPGQAVRLKNFTIVEWFPWLPGRYWTNWGLALRYRAAQRVMIERPQSLKRYGNILTPSGKSLSVLGGVGSVRMRVHGMGKSRFKIVGATTGTDASGAVPVVMSEKGYDSVRRIIERHGSASVTLDGIYSELPMALDDLFHTSWGTPRSCVYVGSNHLVHDAKRGAETKVAAWTIYDRKKPSDINLAYCYFDALDPTGPARAGQFLEDYISNFKGQALTDFDETVSRLESTLPITSLTKNNLDLTKLDSLTRRIRSIYRTRGSQDTK